MHCGHQTPCRSEQIASATQMYHSIKDLNWIQLHCIVQTKDLTRSSGEAAPAWWTSVAGGSVEARGSRRALGSRRAGEARRSGQTNSATCARQAARSDASRDTAGPGNPSLTSRSLWSGTSRKTVASAQTCEHICLLVSGAKISPGLFPRVGPTSSVQHNERDQSSNMFYGNESPSSVGQELCCELLTWRSWQSSGAA